MSILITGGLGFVGTYLKPVLEELGEVTVSTRKKSIPGTLHLDLLDYSQTKNVLENYHFDNIIHLASQSSVQLSLLNPLNTITDNISTTLNLLRAAEHLKNSPRIILAGTAELYHSASTPISENSELDPKNPYALSKLIPDIMTRYSHLIKNLNITNLRLFNHSGPGQSENFVLGSFSKQIASIKKGLTPPVLRVGNLSSRRDIIDVRDVCRAYALVTANSESGQVYNICSGKAYVIEELLNKILEMAEIEVEIRQDPQKMRPSDTPIIQGDYSKFKNKYHWDPKITIEQTLHDMLNWWMERL